MNHRSIQYDQLPASPKHKRNVGHDAPLRLTSAGAILLAEREQGTLKRLLALPIAPESILLGKYFYLYVIGLVQMSILMVYGEKVFGVGLFRDPVTCGAGLHLGGGCYGFPVWRSPLCDINQAG